MRTAHREPPVSGGTPPRVASASGLGVGGGVEMRADVPSHGYLSVMVGREPSKMGGVEIYFPDGAPPMFVTADEAFDEIAVTQTDEVVSVFWMQAALIEGTRLRINFELE